MSGLQPDNASMASYQRVLMLLPQGYRERRGEEILGTLLDAAQNEGRGGPTIREILSILSLSVRLRTGAVGGSTRAEAVGTLLRRVALASLLLQSAIYTVHAYGLASETDTLWRSWLSVGSTEMHEMAVVEFYQAAWQATAVAAVSLALVSLVSGRKRLGLMLAAIGPLSVVVGVDVPTGDTFALGLDGPVNGIYVAMVGLGLLSLITGAFGFQRSDRQRSARRWVIALVAVDAVLLAVIETLMQTNDLLPGNRFLMPSICVVPAVAFAARAGRLSPVWPLALLTTGAPLLALLPRTVTDLNAAGTRAFYGASATFDILGAANLAGEVLFAGILAWSVYRNRAAAPELSNERSRV